MRWIAEFFWIWLLNCRHFCCDAEFLSLTCCYAWFLSWIASIFIVFQNFGVWIAEFFEFDCWIADIFVVFQNFGAWIVEFLSLNCRIFKFELQACLLCCKILEFELQKCYWLQNFCVLIVFSNKRWFNLSR